MMKKFTLLIGLLLLSFDCFALRQPLILSTSDSPATGATNYNYITASGAQAWNATETNRQSVVSSSGSIKEMRVLLTVPAGASKSYDFTLRVNASDSSATCTVSGATDTTCRWVGSVSVTAGDLLSIKSVPTGTPTATRASIGFAYESDTTDQSILTSHYESGLSRTVTEYHGVSGGFYGAGTESISRQLISTAGTIKRLYANVSASPASGKSWQFTIFKNGSATSLTCTISNTATACNDTSNTVSVVAGDYLSIRVVPSGTPTASRGTWSVSLDPTTAGESLFVGSMSNTFSASATNYISGTHLGSSSTVEVNSRLVFPSNTAVKNMYLNTKGSTAGTGKSFAITVRKNGIDTALTDTISDSETTESETATTALFSGGDWMTVKSVPSGTPTALGVMIGFTVTEYTEDAKSGSRAIIIQ